jgi:hypothetical protein
VEKKKSAKEIAFPGTSAVAQHEERTRGEALRDSSKEREIEDATLGYGVQTGV